MKIAQETLEALSLIKIDTFGAVLIETKLDRKLYLKVNEVLEACGFGWSKKAKTHLVAIATPDGVSCARAKLEDAILFGDVETHKDVGFFETPVKLAEQLVAMADVGRGHHALEPSAGRGRIARALFTAGACVTVVERDLERRDHLKHGRIAPNSAPWAQVIDTVEDCDDFMAYQSDDWFDRIVMNPPFCKVGLGDHLDHVFHAYESFLKPGGQLVAVLPAGIVFRKDKRHREFREWVDQHGGVVRPLPDDAFVESGTGVRTVALHMIGASEN